jgi:hypothetical protein
MEPVRVEFSLSTDERDELGKIFGLNLPESTRCHALRTYANKTDIWLECTVAQAAETVAEQVGLDVDDLAALPQDEDLSEVTAAAKRLAKEHRDSGEKSRATSLTTFANELEKYRLLIGDEGLDAEQEEALWERVPSFFYFSNYDTLPGETNLTDLAGKLGADAVLSAKERTVVSLLEHAGEAPGDFLDEDYDSRKAELQAASTDLSRQGKHSRATGVLR